MDKLTFVTMYCYNYMLYYYSTETKTSKLIHLGKLSFGFSIME